MKQGYPPLARRMLDGFVPWPEEVARRYERDGYWLPQTLGGLLRDGSRDHGGRQALTDGDRRWTYTELDAWVDCVAADFVHRGIRFQDRVVVHLPNLPEFVTILFALARIGAVPILALPAHRRSEIRHFVDLAEATAYVCPDRIEDFDYRKLAGTLLTECPSLEQVFVVGDPGPYTPIAARCDRPTTAPQQEGAGLWGQEPDAADVVVLLVSGGTTGSPKLVPRTHRDWLYSGRAVAAACSFDESTVYLAAQPIAHNWTLTHGLLTTFGVGAKLVLAPGPGPVDAFRLIEREGVTDTGLVPSVLNVWLAAARRMGTDLSSLRRVTVGASKPSRSLIDRVESELGCKLQQAFGMAEGLCGFHRSIDSDDVVLASQGFPVSPADELMVIDERGDPVPCGQVGELLTRGPYTVRGYYRSPEHNAEAFTDDGYFRTGDLVRILESGHVVFEGRLKDQINRGGEKVATEEVESHLAAHPCISEAAVVGWPDPRFGERVAAFVVSVDSSLSLGEIEQFLLDRGLAAFKIPERLEIVDALPLTPVGKVAKKELQGRLMS